MSLNGGFCFQKYLDEQRRIQEEQEEALASRQQAVTKRPHTTTPLVNPATAASSMSRRNLETIVEAIRHLEGDNVLFDSVKKASTMDCDTESEDGAERDSMFMSSSSVISGSERDDCKSDTSGRDSPLSKYSDVGTAYAVTATTTTVRVPPHREDRPVSPHVLSSHRYSSQLLRQTPVLSTQLGPKRPAVIVKNLS